MTDGENHYQASCHQSKHYLLLALGVDLGGLAYHLILFGESLVATFPYSYAEASALREDIAIFRVCGSVFASEYPRKSDRGGILSGW